MTAVRSRRARISAGRARQRPMRPMYARVLGLQHLQLSNLLCFVFFEGVVVFAALLAFAELAQWWVVLVMPVSVAATVKLNDIVAGAVLKAGRAQAPKALGRARVPVRAPVHGGPWAGVAISGAGMSTAEAVVPASPAGADERFGSPEQRAG